MIHLHVSYISMTYFDKKKKFNWNVLFEIQKRTIKLKCNKNVT